MLDFIKGLLAKTPRWAVGNDALDRDTQVVWGISRSLALLIWVLSPLFFNTGGWLNFVSVSLTLAVFTAPAVLISLRRVRTAKVVFMAGLVIVPLMLALEDGPASNAEWIVAMMPMIGYVTFGRERHFFWLSLGFVGYVAIELIYRYHQPWMPPLPSGMQQVYKFSVAAGVCLFIYWLMVVFKREAARSEEALRAQHGALLESQQAIARQNTELRHFAYAASHDMKEPLRNMGSFAHLLGRRLANDSASLELLQFIEDGAKRMSRLLDDLIRYAGVGMAKSPVETVNLGEKLRHVEANLHSALQQAGGRLEIGQMPTVMAHRALMLQLFQNLVGNGLKYRRPDVPPVVQVRFLKKDGNLLFVVRDNGIGIAPEFVERIFEPFRRLHNRAEYDGSGIGLATCRKIAEFYGGKIWAESTLGAGTAFCVELPGAMLVEQAQTAEREAFMVAASNMD